MQEELAALILEEPVRRSFAKGKQAHLRSRGVKGTPAKILASLNADDVAYFGARREIDRRGALRFDLPRSLALMDHEGKLLSYFRTYPYALEDPLKEAARVATWAKDAERKGHTSRLLTDLAAFEASFLAARSTPVTPSKASARPRRAPGLRLLHLAHDLEAALTGAEDDVPEASARECFLLMTVGPDAEAGEIAPVVFHLLRGATGRRTEVQLAVFAADAAGVPRAEARRELATLRAEGLLSSPA